MQLNRQEWVVALLIGLTTITGAFFGWRAAQIGSTAAFEDRISIGATISQEQAQIDVDLGAAGDAATYTRYLSSYAVAAALDAEAASGAPDAAALRREAADLRRGAALVAAGSEVFGRSSIGGDLRRPRRTPRAFDFDDHRAALSAENATNLRSGGSFDPQGAADRSEAIRDRIGDLVGWVAVLGGALLMFTIAQVWRERTGVFYAFAAAGLILFLIGAAGGLSFGFFESSL